MRRLSCCEARDSECSSIPNVTLFETSLGWMGLVHSSSAVQSLAFGYSSRQALLGGMKGRGLLRASEVQFVDSPLAARLHAYADGTPDDFRDVEVDLGSMTPFRRRVISWCRRIPWGKSCTYRELAARAGAPGASRAVGSCMAANPVPLIIPCHRVVGAGGRLCGYSGEGGVGMKQRLLDLEKGGVFVWSGL